MSALPQHSPAANITQTHLEAALLDQKIAGQMAGKTYAFVTVAADDAWGLGVAVLNERGYNPIDGKTFTTQAEANAWADGLNAHMRLTQEQVSAIVISTMRGAWT
jgi:hypothetical protein